MLTAYGSETGHVIGLWHDDEEDGGGFPFSIGFSLSLSLFLVVLVTTYRDDHLHCFTTQARSSLTLTRDMMAGVLK